MVAHIDPRIRLVKSSRTCLSSDGRAAASCAVGPGFNSPMVQLKVLRFFYPEGLKRAPVVEWIVFANGPSTMLLVITNGLGLEKSSRTCLSSDGRAAASRAVGPGFNSPMVQLKVLRFFCRGADCFCQWIFSPPFFCLRPAGSLLCQLAIYRARPRQSLVWNGAHFRSIHALYIPLPPRVWTQFHTLRQPDAACENV